MVTGSVFRKGSGLYLQSPLVTFSMLRRKNVFEKINLKCLSTTWWFHTKYVDPYLGKIFILTNIFQRGWNHQLVNQYGRMKHRFGFIFRFFGKDSVHSAPVLGGSFKQNSSRQKAMSDKMAEVFVRLNIR